MRHVGTMVMGTVVAGLLSLALWDTLHDGSEAPSCELQHPEIAMINDLRATKQARLAQLAGPTVASPGEYLRGVTLETPLDRAVADRLPTITSPTTETPYQVTFTEEAGIVRAVEVVVGRFDATYDENCEASDDPCACEFTGDDRALCAALETKLHAAWGPSTSTDAGTRSWVDRDSGARATLASCVLTFDVTR